MASINNDLYAWLRFGTTPGTSLQTIYNHDETKSFGPEQIAKMVMSENNVDYITDLVIGRADPLRNGSSVANRDKVKASVKRILDSWKNMGKFDQATTSFEGKTLQVY